VRFLSRSPALATAAAAALIGAILAWPLRLAHAYLDDHMYLALARHIDDPLALLLQDSTGTYFFRPLVMGVWWLSVAAFGDSAAAHSMLNVGVHLANSFLVYAFARSLALSTPAAALGALLFACHPTPFAATAWLSDRFDLFSTLFGLCTLVAVARFRARPRALTATAAVVAMLASLFSKEIGYVFVVAALLLLAWPALPGDPATRRQRAPLAAAIACCAIVGLVARFAPLRLVQQDALLQAGIFSTVVTGTWAWIASLPGFLFVRHGSMVAYAAWIVAAAGGVALALAPDARRRLLGGGPARAAACGIVIMLSAAALQSPVEAAMELTPFIFGHFNYASLAGSRLYYVPLAGFAMIAAALADAVVAASSRRVHAAFATLAVIGLAALVATGRAIGSDWAVYTSERADFADAAVDAIAPRRDLAPGCKIYLLGVPVRGLEFVITSDAAVKQSLPRGHPAIGCFIQTERSPWYNLVATRALPPGAERPLQTVMVQGRAFPPLRVANLAYYYLEVPDSPEVIDDPRALFLGYEGMRFVDVTREVRERRRALQFRQVRPSR
jgi:hypothetical protein